MNFKNLKMKKILIVLLVLSKSIYAKETESILRINDSAGSLFFNNGYDP